METPREISRNYSSNPKPLGDYSALMIVFSILAALFTTLLKACGRSLPERMPLPDVLLLGAASHKISRLVAKDKVTSPIRAPFTRYEEHAGPAEVEEKPRGSGLQRTVGEMISCPYCLDVWVASVLSAGLVLLPRPTRLV
ncbi:MAG TPA: DUF1360 domain-containing protein, partial [Chthoniobacterales bacterium]